MNRAKRRHHIVRIKAKRKTYHGGNLDPAKLGKAVHTAAPCSCYACGNPRKHFDERTIQERRAMQEIES